MYFFDMGQLESQWNLGSKIEEASDLVRKQLEQLRAEKKELKRVRKQEKAKLKAAQSSTNMLDSESLSSSSSKSSDNECEKVIDMYSLRNSPTSIQPKLKEVSRPFLQEIPALSLPSSVTSCQEVPNKTHDFEDGRLQNEKEEISYKSNGVYCCSLSGTDHVNDSVTISSTSTRIEVCMGNKFKKAGAVALLEEFERLMEVEGSVVGCTCMGKCTNGPNVRVLNCIDGIQAEAIDDCVKRVETNPLCIGVGLKDVGGIVSILCRGEKKDLEADYQVL